MTKIGVTLISGRTSQQGVALEIGKFSEQYKESVSYLELNPCDAEEIGINEGESVRVKTKIGSIILSGKQNKGLDRGIAFVPYGLWANMIFGSETGGTGMPAFKGIPATVESVKGEDIPTLEQLVELLREK